MKKAVLIPLATLALFFLTTPTAMAPATKTPFTARMTLTPVSQGKVWITPDGIQQVRGAIATGYITGNITGSLKVIEDSTFNLTTGEGSSHGKVVITTPDGTFEGIFTGTTTGYYYFSGKAMGHGTGAYEGQKIMGTYEGHAEIIDGVPTAIADIEGIILSPHG